MLSFSTVALLYTYSRVAFQVSVSALQLVGRSEFLWECVEQPSGEGLDYYPIYKSLSGCPSGNKKLEKEQKMEFIFFQGRSRRFEDSA